MSLFRPNYRCAAPAALLAGALALLAGCRTQQDAVAAASQMAATAQTLSAYYAALDRVLADTQDAYQAQYALLGVPPEDLSETRSAIELRAALAKQLGQIAGLFQKTTGPAGDAEAAAKKEGSSAPAIDPAVIAKLAESAAAQSGISARPSSAASTGTAAGASSATSSSAAESPALEILANDSDAISKGIDAILALVREHEEVKAAKQLAPLCDHLAKFFNSETPTYDSINQAYLVTAKSVARKMVQDNEVDTSTVFNSSLQPFGLSPVIDKIDIKVGLQPFLLAQIDTQYDVKLRSALQATAALDTALGEMDARIRLVAHDKPMSLRLPPFSLSTVNSWINQIAQ